MKNIISLLSIILLLVSCSKDEPKEDMGHTVSYYVNYSPYVHFDSTVKVTYTGDYGKEETFLLSGSKTIIARHIPKTTTVRLTMAKPNDGSINARIEVWGKTVASFSNSHQEETLTWRFE